jgi:hypothetical protein
MKYQRRFQFKYSRKICQSKRGKNGERASRQSRSEKTKANQAKGDGREAVVGLID